MGPAVDHLPACVSSDVPMPCGDSADRSLDPFTSSSWLALKLSEVVHGLRLDIRGVFCFTAAMLGSMSLPTCHPSAFTDRHFAADDDGHEMVAASKEAMRQMPDDVMKSRTRWKAFRALGAFAVLLRQAIKDHQVFNMPVRHGDVVLVATTDTADASTPHVSLIAIEREHYTASDVPGSIALQKAADRADALEVVKPPAAREINMLPLNCSYSMPLPFHKMTQRQIVSGNPSNWEAWNDAHVAAMCMPLQLKNSKWEGYYLDQRDGSISDGRTGFSPIADVTIKRAFEEVPDPLSPAMFGGLRRTRLEVKGHGRDPHGRFELRGTIEQKGQILMRADYVGRQEHWYWQASMTPFGMFGTWGTRDGFHANVVAAGAVWLWRKEWTD